MVPAQMPHWNRSAILLNCGGVTPPVVCSPSRGETEEIDNNLDGNGHSFAKATEPAAAEGKSKMVATFFCV